MTLDSKEQIITKPVLRAKDIQALTGYTINYCYIIMKDIKERIGVAGIRNDVVKTEDFFTYIGSSIEREMYLLGIAKGNIKIET